MFQLTVYRVRGEKLLFQSCGWAGCHGNRPECHGHDERVVMFECRKTEEVVCCNLSFANLDPPKYVGRLVSLILV